jgi:hypothetical protein
MQQRIPRVPLSGRTSELPVAQRKRRGVLGILGVWAGSKRRIQGSIMRFRFEEAIMSVTTSIPWLDKCHLLGQKFSGFVW